jgi:hypothetical protein
MDVSFDRIESIILQVVGAQLVQKSDATALLS